MKLEQATLEQLEQLKILYKKTVNDMKQQNLFIWDDYYPSEVIEGDIINQELFILKEHNTIVSSIVLCLNHTAKESFEWSLVNSSLYIERFVVDPLFKRQGLAHKMIDSVVDFAKEKGIKRIRLLVVDFNEPALSFYKQYGFIQVNGIHQEIIDENTVFNELAFEYIIP